MYVTKKNKPCTDHTVTLLLNTVSNQYFAVININLVNYHWITLHRWCNYIQIAHHKSRNSTLHGVQINTQRLYRYSRVQMNTSGITFVGVQSSPCHGSSVITHELRQRNDVTVRRDVTFQPQTNKGLVQLSVERKDCQSHHQPFYKRW
jgi:hypothetical protein